MKQPEKEAAHLLAQTKHAIVPWLEDIRADYLEIMANAREVDVVRGYQERIRFLRELIDMVQKAGR